MIWWKAKIFNCRSVRYGDIIQRNDRTRGTCEGIDGWVARRFKTPFGKPIFYAIEAIFKLVEETRGSKGKSTINRKDTLKKFNKNNRINTKSDVSHLHIHVLPGGEERVYGPDRRGNGGAQLVWWHPRMTTIVRRLTYIVDIVYI